MSARFDRLVERAHRAIRTEGGFASDHLARLFRTERDLPESVRGEIASRVYALLRQEPLPKSLIERIRLEYGAEADALIGALAEPPPQAIRANTLKISRDALASHLANEGVVTRPTTYARAGLIVDPPRAIFRTDAFRRGELEVQDEGSQLVAELVAPPPGGTVIDACAGAGGKTLAIAAALEGRGRVVSLDVDRDKLVELRRRARRAGASNVRAIAIPREGPWPEELKALASKIDRVLVDAPCSGVGVLRRNPEARSRLSEEELARFPELQRSIAKRALELVPPGGRLVYATCTILEAENEAIVARLCAEDQSLERVRVAEIFGKAWAEPISDERGLSIHLLPHRHTTDGFFAAVLRRRRS
jgi:16S rRNA (cytosine967-C5)-methyltransferase